MIPSSADPRPASSAIAPSSPTPVIDGEIRTVAKVSFEVRPLGGPGTMGPTVLSAKSDPALEEVRAYLSSHPDVGPLRIECTVNPTRMSSSPDAKWPAGLSLQIARWLVNHGLDCGRLDAVGRLDAKLDSAGERVRFFVDPSGRELAEKDARLDVCSSLE